MVYNVTTFCFLILTLGGSNVNTIRYIFSSIFKAKKSLYIAWVTHFRNGMCNTPTVVFFFPYI